MSLAEKSKLNRIQKSCLGNPGGFNLGTEK